MSGSGQILTFYSYKGGTGRSMALANIAWILASAGNRVLMIDWDLEAPGLHRYFRPFLVDHELTASEGLIELADRYATEAIRPSDATTGTDWYLPLADVSDYIVSINHSFPSKGRLDFLPAGRQNDAYAVKVNTFDWKNFYDRLGGGGFFEAVKARTRLDYEYVLIDSRTGVSDTSGICSVQMPDTLVVCFTYNNQSIRGASSVARSAMARRALLDDKRRSSQVQDAAPTAAVEDSPRPYRIFPVPMRVDNSESDRLELRRAYARNEFKNFVDPLTDPVGYWSDVEVPHHPFYAYEEVLSPFKDEARDQKTVLAAFVRIGARLTLDAVNEYRSLITPEQQQQIRERYAETPLTALASAALAAKLQETEEQALVRRADAAVANLTEQSRQIAIRVFGRLVRLATAEEGVADIATRAPLTDFSDIERSIIVTLQQAGLLTVATETRTAARRSGAPAEQFVSFADERLVRLWPPLVQWLDSDREFLEWRQRLRPRLADWQASGRDTDALLRGRLLNEADLWMNRRGDELSVAEAGYVRASLGIDDPAPVSGPPASAPGPATAVYLSDGPSHTLPDDVSRVIGDDVDEAIRRDSLPADVAFGTAVKTALQRCQALVFAAGELSPAQASELAIAMRHRAAVGGHFRIIPAVAAGESGPAPPISVDPPATFTGDVGHRGLERLTAGTAAPRMPYPGTRAFRTEESELYRGPAAFIDGLVEEVHRSSHVSVSGDPGSGRTSVIQAGLIPRLLAQEAPADTWKALTCHATRDFWGELAAAFARAQGQVSPDEGGANVAAEWQQGRSSLPAAVTATLSAMPATDRLLLVVDGTAEAEQWALGPLRAWLEDLPVTLVTIGTDERRVPSLTHEELRDAVEMPAAKLGVPVEAAFVDELLADVEQSARPLPLLQWCLARMLEGMPERGLTREGYAALRPPAAAVARWAEEATAAIDRAGATRLLSRLVVVAKPLGGAPVFVSRPYVIAPDDRLRPVMLQLEAAGIVTRAGERDGIETLRFSHALLPDLWPWLMEALVREESFLELRQRLESLVAREGLPYSTPAENVARFTSEERDRLLMRREDLTDAEVLYVSQMTDAANQEARLQRQSALRSRVHRAAAAAVLAAMAGSFGLYRWWTADTALPPMRLEPGKPLQVTVIDSQDRPLANRNVSWQVDGCGTSSIVTTDSTGVAATEHPCPTLKPGTYPMTIAIVPDDAGISFGDDKVNRRSPVRVTLEIGQ